MNRLWILTALLAATLAAQQENRLTLVEAEQIALRNHPQLAAARLNADAATENINQAKAALKPVVSANVVGSLAAHENRWGASGLLNPGSLFSRTAAGLNINQTLYDFGRTRTLTGAAKTRAAAQAERIGAARAEVLLRVREAYYRALLSQTQYRVAQKTLSARQVTLKQIRSLTESSLRSTLDLSFAELAVSEAEVALDRADNERRAAMVRLSAALGSSEDQQYVVEDQPDPEPLADSPDGLITAALQERPDLAALRLDVQAAKLAADNERRQGLPTIAAMGAGGGYGPKDQRIVRPYYAGMGVNMNIPIFNGHIFSSRQKEALLRAQAAEQTLRNQEIAASRDVRTAWLDARNAFGRLALTSRVLDQAVRTLRLAQSRYDLGLSSVVELSQAQLAQTSAEVSAAAARYEYLLQRSVLDFHIGRQ